MERPRSGARLMNVKIPAYVADQIDAIADELGATKIDVVIALLNQGFVVAERQMVTK